MRFSRTSSSPGFSIVELALVIAIIPLITLVFIAMLYTAINESRRSATKTTYDSRAQIAMDWLEHDIRYATNFLTTVNNAQYPDPNDYGPAGTEFSYSGQSSSLRTLIITSPATSDISLNTNRNLIFKKDTPFPCTSAQDNEPLEYLSVYFVKNNTLYKRTIPDTTSAICGPTSSIRQKLSCPRSVASCTVFDEIVAENVTQFSINYHRASPPSLLNVYTTSNLMADAIAADITITITQPSGSNPISSTISLKITKVNS